MNILKTLGAIALNVVALVLFVGLMSLLLAGTAWWTHHIVGPVIGWLADHALPPLEIAGAVVFAIDLVVLLPLSAFRSCRPFAGICLLLSSFWFGFVVWLASAVVVYDIWGTWGVLIGLLLGIIGVIPLALLASLVHGYWAGFFDVIEWLALLFVVRGYALFLSSRKQTTEE